MNQHKHSPHQPGPHHDSPQHGDGPYWKNAHRDWRFWVGVLMVVGAMAVYVMTENLAFRPGAQPSAPGLVGR